MSKKGGASAIRRILAAEDKKCDARFENAEGNFTLRRSLV